MLTDKELMAVVVEDSEKIDKSLPGKWFSFQIWEHDEYGGDVVNRYFTAVANDEAHAKELAKEYALRILGGDLIEDDGYLEISDDFEEYDRSQQDD